ncbi:holocytochrome-c synthase [Papiliotrema laurentii]|uniref:Holocytochrome c-type synthase n=1 Tax=Papiliotrema laurentii TaxID=5418 RepID=A0AAD9CYI8_PAPLA|nr:holocytochrome-c synthase [Papiliotrema laurentii]
MPFFNIGSTAAASSSSTAVLPPDHPPVPAGTDACPVDHSVRSKWLEAAPSTSNPLHHPPSFSSGPQKPGKLSDEREISSIPRGKASSSDHIGSSEGRGVEHEKWVYPSERQFYNAMQRKNHNPKAKDMKSVVPIHNAVNEKAWEEILMWEAGMGGEKCGGCRLLSFSGRPKDRTPKAWINVALGYTPPFDRHDWIIDRCGTQVRYVIDFYTGRTDPNNPKNMAFYLDVRPALDSYEGWETRAKGLWRQWTS